MRRLFYSLQLSVCGCCLFLLAACSKDWTGSSPDVVSSTLEARASASAGERAVASNSPNPAPVQSAQGGSLQEHESAAVSSPNREPAPVQSAQGGSAAEQESAAVQTQRQPATNAAPLNLEIGFATAAGAQAVLDSQLQPIGRNEYTGGPMFGVEASSIGLKGLKRAVLIFGQDEVLKGAVLTFVKDPKGMFELLRQKYSVDSNRINRFMNNGTARLEKGHTWIEIDAPHLSHEMEVLYLDKDLKALFKKRQAERRAAEEHRKVDQL